MKGKSIPFVYVLLITVSIICLFGFIFREPVKRESYVKLDGKYYYSVGANIDPSFIGEQIGTVERRAPKTIFNRNGDSNQFAVGAKIYAPPPDVAAESDDIIYVEYTQIYVRPDQTEEEITEYALLKAG